MMGEMTDTLAKITEAAKKMRAFRDEICKVAPADWNDEADVYTPRTSGGSVSATITADGTPDQPT